MPPFADGGFRASTTDLHQLRVAEARADVDDSVVEVRDAFGDRRLKTECRSSADHSPLTSSVDLEEGFTNRGALPPGVREEGYCRGGARRVALSKAVPRIEALVGHPSH